MSTSSLANERSSISDSFTEVHLTGDDDGGSV